MRRDCVGCRDRRRLDLGRRLGSESDCSWLWLMMLMERVSGWERCLEHANEVPNPLGRAKLQRQTTLRSPGRRDAQVREVESAAKVAVEL